MIAGVLGLFGLYLLGSSICCGASHLAFTAISEVRIRARVSPRGLSGSERRELFPLVSAQCDALKNEKGVRVRIRSSAGNDENNIGGRSERRHSRLVMEYRAASLASLLTALQPLIVLLGGSPTAQPICFFLYAMSGPLLAAAVSHILGGAALCETLQSHAHKRLNLALIIYSLLNAFAFAIVRPPDRRYFLPLLTSSIVLSLPAFEGFTSTMRDIKEHFVKTRDIVSDLVMNFRLTAVRSIMHFDNATSIGYLAPTLLLTVTLVLKLADITAIFMSNGLHTADTTFALASEITTYAKLALFFIVVLTLKGTAYDQKEKIKGMTFVELNSLSSFTFGVLSAYWMEKGAFFLHISAALCSMFTGLNGLVSGINNLHK